MHRLACLALVAANAACHSASPSTSTAGAPAPSAPVAVSARASASASAPSSPSAPDPLTPVYAKGLEGDMRAGLALLTAVDPAHLDVAQAKQRACIVHRFSDPEPLANQDEPRPFLARVLDAYRAYWRRVLLKELDPAAGEAYLRDRLRPVLADGERAGKAPETLDALTDALGKKFEGSGLHSIRGVTRPYYDLMVWRTAEPKRYQVNLPDGPVSVDVVLLRDFESLGWSAFATCDRSYTGGWAEKDKLYCVADSYDLTSEAFSVSYLAHEAQHFADYKRFPKLDQPELEYRAILTELIASKQTTRHLVETYASEQGDSRSAPHAYANRAVIRGLAGAIGIADSGVEAWRAVDEARIRGAAAELFKANTALLVSKGAATVKEVL